MIALKRGAATATAPSAAQWGGGWQRWEVQPFAVGMLKAAENISSFGFDPVSTLMIGVYTGLEVSARKRIAKFCQGGGRCEPWGEGRLEGWQK